MKTIILLLAVFVASLLNAQETNSSTVTVSVKNIQKPDGQVRLALYSEENFMQQPLQAKNSIIENGQVSIVFENVAPGTYAILGFHDENNNEKMDFEMNGMPKEDYGASNNAMNYGPPQWSDAKFEVGAEPVNLEIKF